MDLDVEHVRAELAAGRMSCPELLGLLNSRARLLKRDGESVPLAFLRCFVRPGVDPFGVALLKLLREAELRSLLTADGKIAIQRAANENAAI